MYQYCIAYWSDVIDKCTLSSLFIMEMHSLHLAITVPSTPIEMKKNEVMAWTCRTSIDKLLPWYF